MIEPLLEESKNINFLAVQNYLRAKGWVKKVTGWDDAAVFNKQSEYGLSEILLPLKREFEDYAYSIYQALQSISKFENITLQQVVNEISLPPSDIIRFRVDSPKTHYGTISLEDGTRFIESAKRSLYASASDITKPEAYHKRMSFKDSDQFLEECRLGQTEKGSFVLAIICPFLDPSSPDQPRQLSLFKDPEDLSEEIQNSFTRKVTSHFMRSLKRIQSAAKQIDPRQILESEMDGIISGNFLEALLELNSFTQDAELEIKGTFYNSLEEDESIPRSVQFSKDYNPFLEEAISLLKPKDEGVKDVFFGRISSVKANPDLNLRNEGEVIINTLVDEDKVINAKVILGPEDYALACDAHANGKQVKIEGVLINKVIQNPVFYLA